MELSRSQFLKLLVVVGAPGALATACSSNATPATAPAPDAGSAGSTGTSPPASDSGASSDASTSGSSGGVDASNDAIAAGDAPSPDCNANGAKAGIITGNHGHSLLVAVADFADGLQHVYSIKGLATHNHTVTLSATDLMTIKSGGMVTITSSTNVHMHDVTVLCA